MWFRNELSSFAEVSLYFQWHGMPSCFLKMNLKLCHYFSVYFRLFHTFPHHLLVKPQWEWVNAWYKRNMETRPSDPWSWDHSTVLIEQNKISCHTDSHLKTADTSRTYSPNRHCSSIFKPTVLYTGRNNADEIQFSNN